MIENIGVLINNRKQRGIFGKKKKIDVIDSDSSSIEEAKAKVYAIINEGKKKQEKNR
jgi:regulator of PEP synthase PpsR (kinase-PPPase family)